MAQEIERKFMVKSNAFKTEAFKSTHITQGYLSSVPERTVRVRVKGDKENYYPHTLNNTVLASTRSLIALVENNYQKDGSIIIPEVLRPYMGGLEIIKKK